MIYTKFQANLKWYFLSAKVSASQNYFSWSMFIHVITWIFTIFCFYYLIKCPLKNELDDANNRRSKYCYRLTRFCKNWKFCLSGELGHAAKCESCLIEARSRVFILCQMVVQTYEPDESTRCDLKIFWMTYGKMDIIYKHSFFLTYYFLKGYVGWKQLQPSCGFRKVPKKSYMGS